MNEVWILEYARKSVLPETMVNLYATKLGAYRALIDLYWGPKRLWDKEDASARQELEELFQAGKFTQIGNTLRVWLDGDDYFVITRKKVNP